MGNDEVRKLIDQRAVEYQEKARAYKDEVCKHIDILGYGRVIAYIWSGNIKELSAAIAGHIQLGYFLHIPADRCAAIIVDSSRESFNENVPDGDFDKLKQRLDEIFLEGLKDDKPVPGIH